MVGIPRFDAQIGRISVPTMQNFQQEQNEQIYKAVAGVANTTAKIAEDLYSAQKIHEATVEGGKATKETDLSQLPTPLTKAQEAYNNSAIASFYSDFSVDAERKINVSAFNNEDNPAQFLVETDAYINGIAKNIPDHLRKQVLRPIQMVREAKYDTLLKHKTERNRSGSIETFKFNMWRKRKNANLIASDADLDNYLADAEATAATFLSIGGRSEDAMKYLNDSYEDGLNRYLSQYYMKEKISPTEFKNFYKDIQLGKTGIRALDMMPPERRISIGLKAFDDLNKSENILSEKNFTMTSNKEAEMNLNYLSKRSDEEFSYENPAYGVGYVNQNIIAAQKNIQNGTQTISKIGNIDSVTEDAKYGRISFDDLIELKKIGSVGDEDFLQLSEIVLGYKSKNRKLPEFTAARNLIISSNPNKEDEYGQIIATNEKQAFLLKKLDRFADQRELSGVEITEYVNSIISEANNSFKGESAYKDNFTRDKFYSMFSVKYEDINSIASKYIIGNQISKSKIKKAVIEKYKVSSSKANALLSYWLNLRKLEGK